MASESQTHPPELQYNANADAPPPDYSTHTPNQSTPPSSQHSPVNVIPGHYPSPPSRRQYTLFTSGDGSSHLIPPSTFGPTPLIQSEPTLGLLPYYDPQSPHSIKAATSRAKWRFIGATLWAIGLTSCFLLLGTLATLRLWAI